jgi:hypothetical protein
LANHVRGSAPVRAQPLVLLTSNSTRLGRSQNRGAQPPNHFKGELTAAQSQPPHIRRRSRNSAGT